MANPQHNTLAEKINRVVRDLGDIELFLRLDQIMDKETDSERATALGMVVKDIAANKQKSN